jgi:hypothetical protein
VPSDNPSVPSASPGNKARSTDQRPALGRRGEEHAISHMHRLGFSPLGRNERTRYGEIDLIAFNGRTLVFAEVIEHYARLQVRTYHVPIPTYT